ncbi:MAG: ABC transporter transmembrane domain-containing protein [Pseudomonadota bacterium]
MGFVTRSKSLGTEVQVVLSSLVLNLLALLMPLGILLIFDRVIPFQATETLTLLTLMLIVSAAIEFGLRWCRSVILSWSAEQGAVQNHDRFMGHVLGANTRAFSSQSKPGILERYSAIARLRDFYAGQNQALGIDIAFTAVFVAMIALIGGPLVIVPLGALVLIIAFSVVTKRTQAAVFNQRKSLDERRYSFLSEVLAGIVPLKANMMERQMSRRFEMLQEQSVGSSRRLILFAGFAQNFSAVFSQFCVASMGLVGAFFVIQGTIGIAELAACMMLNGRVTQPLMKLITLWVQSESIAMQKTKLADIEGLPRQELRPLTPTALTGRITLTNLRLQARDGESAQGVALDGQVAPGQIALIDGPQANAHLAQQVFDVLAGQAAPLAGRARIDGRPAADLAAARGRGALVVLEGDAALFRGTIIENISAFGSPEEADRAVAYAVLLGLEKRVNRLPFGYNTQLGTGNHFERDPVNRHLISLVRAFSLKPTILLMNEPTAVLDQAERDAFKAFLSGLEDRPTIMMFSPDPRMKALADITITAANDTDRTIEAFDADAQLDRASLEQAGAA